MVIVLFSQRYSCASHNHIFYSRAIDVKKEKSKLQHNRGKSAYVR